MRPTQQSATPSSTLGVNPNYVLGQLAKALRASEEHESAEVRKRAARKVEKWTQVFQGLLSGALAFGSRTPVADTPPWATLEVVHGGFATGGLLAGGPLQAHERELLNRLPAVPEGAERAALNAYFLTDAGLDELRQMLASGRYRVGVPEEGALLVVAWLLEHGLADQARSLLDVLAPHFAHLRFYPIPDPQPLLSSSVVHLQEVGKTIEDLQGVRPSPLFEQQKEAVQVWSPLYDRVVELFVETVEGPAPTLKTGEEGKPLRSEKGSFLIEGGWPCQRYPEGWKARAQGVLSDYERLRKENKLCSSPESATGGFATLRGYLEKCVAVPEGLTGRDVGMIRSILAGILTKRGLPGTPRWRQKPERQARQVAGPSRADLARLVLVRLAPLPRDRGLPSLDEALAPVSAEEATRFGLPAGHAMPEGLCAKVQRSLDAPLEELVERGVIPSGEVLARVVPQVTAQVRGAGIADPALRLLYGAIYQAFRRRRSLLLLNLEAQVKLEELPWVRALGDQRRDGLNEQQQARQVLEQVVVLALTAFPQQILPNKLLQEIRALSEGAGLRLPIVDEVAADIFMGEFSEKYLRAAQKAAEMLQGTLYERYYGLPYASVRRMDVQPSRFGTPTCPEFIELCMSLAGQSAGGRGRNVAYNGTIIEQEQILTTHNLAVLFDALGLAQTLRPRLDELARNCFTWVCRRQQQTGAWKARLQMMKNTAYAWRQMVFFLSLAPAGTAEAFISWASGRLQEQEQGFRERFHPVLRGLAQAVCGEPVEAPGRRFLGWTTQRHWLLA